MLEPEQRDLNYFHIEDFSAPMTSLELHESIFVDSNMKIEEAMKIIIEKGFGSLLIGSASKVEGIVTERDFLFKVSKNFEEKKNSPLSEIMTPNPLYLNEEDSILSAITLMCEKEIRHIPIKTSSTYKMISVNDLISYFINHFKDDLEQHGTKIAWSKDGVYLQEFVHYDHDEHLDDVELSPLIFETPLRKIMFRDALHCGTDSTIEELLDLLIKNRKGSALVMDFETELKGIISERDLLRKVYGQVDITTSKVIDYMTPDPHKLLEQDLIAVAINNMSKFKYRSVIVANQEGYPISLVTILDILKYISTKLKEKDEKSEQ